MQCKFHDLEVNTQVIQETLFLMSMFMKINSWENL